MHGHSIDGTARLTIVTAASTNLAPAAASSIKSAQMELEVPDSEDSIEVRSNTSYRSPSNMPAPQLESRKRKRISKLTDSPAATASSSSKSSTPRERSSEYETPGTTPAMSIASTKRKRVSIKTDEAIALELQQEEYEGETIVAKRPKVLKVEEDTESELSEPESVESFKPRKTVSRAAGRKPGVTLRQQEKVLDGSELSELDESSEFEASSEEDEAESGSEEAEDAQDDGRRHGNIDRRQARRMRQRIRQTIAVRGSRRRDRERTKLEKAHPEIKTMWETLKKIPVIQPSPAQQPKAINRTLKKFQLEGLDWMIKQEKSSYKGGLLGDEMGMGKTIQAVSLIMSDWPQKQPSLVVVPPVALMQWSSEITDYTDGKLKVLVYHGQNSKVKAMTVKDLKKYDVIMISYNSLESLHRKETKGWTRGEDIVKEDSPIHAIHFHRLILDEAHSIKTRTTGIAKACFALTGTYKWCLSGTPVQNRIGEFFSLLRFLEVRPFTDYFCKQCPCAMLHWRVDESHNCVSCGHTSIEHVSVFNQELLNPLTMSENQSDRSAAMSKLHMITARVMLRRLKKDHTSSMELPPKEVIVSSNFFGDVEKDFSTSIMSNSERKFNTYVSRNVVLNNYANIFGLIMQMRQVANHPDLILKKHAEEGQNVLACSICDEVAEDAIKSGCKHDFCRACVKSYITTTEATGAVTDCPRCHIPLVIDLEQPEIEQDENNVKKSSIINRIKMEDWTSSTKIEMLVYELYKLRSKKQTTKSIGMFVVGSCFCVH